jgi:hypothetical protein
MSAEIILNRWAAELLHAAVELTEGIISGRHAITEEIVSLFEQLPEVLEQVMMKTDKTTVRASSLTSSLKNSIEEVQKSASEPYSYYDKDIPALSELDKSFFYELLDA